MPSFLSRRKNFIILISLVLFQMILISVQVPRGADVTLLEQAYFAAFAPLQHGVAAVIRGIGQVWSDFFALRDAQERYHRVMEENFQLRQENILLKQALRRYRDEETLKAMYEGLSDRVIGARMIGMDASDVYKSAIIDRGSLDGLIKDMVVLDAYGNLVGRVSGPIELKQARVQLITDRDCGVSVRVQGGAAPAILKGDGGGLCRLDYSLATSGEPQEGDILETTGFDSIYPSGLRVGQVISVKKRPALFKNVEVRPFFRLRDMDKLAVIERRTGGID
jgi:rod shape-determining protein MreC